MQLHASRVHHSKLTHDRPPWSDRATLDCVVIRVPIESCAAMRFVTRCVTATFRTASRHFREFDLPAAVATGRPAMINGTRSSGYAGSLLNIVTEV